MTTTRNRVRHSPDALQQLKDVLSPIDECIAIYLLESRLPLAHVPRPALRPGLLHLYCVRISFANLMASYLERDSNFYILNYWQPSVPSEAVAYDCVIDDDGSDALVSAMP